MRSLEINPMTLGVAHIMNRLFGATVMYNKVQ